MQPTYSPPFYVAGPPPSLQFYPCFTPPSQQPPMFPMFPNNSGLSYNGPFQDVIGEGDVSSVVLPDGTVQLFFVPATKCGNCYNNNQTTNGSWFIRSVNNPSTLPSNLPICQQNNRMALPPPCAPLCPGCQTNQRLKFHNDQCTSTVDIGLFCPGSQQRYEEQRPHKPCCAGVVCKQPCNCSPDCVGIREPERNPTYESYPERYNSNMSIESRRGKKRTREECCECVSDCSIHCQGKRKRRKRLVRSSSSSSADKRRRWRRLRRRSREKAVKKQCRKQEKDRRARDYRRHVIYEKYHRRSDSDMSIDEYERRSKCCNHCQRPNRSSSSGSLGKRLEPNDSYSSLDRRLRRSPSSSSVASSYRGRKRTRRDKERKKQKKLGGKKIIITKTRRKRNNASTCTNDNDAEQQKCYDQCGQQTNEPAAETCPQAGPSLLSRLSSALSHFIYSPCNSCSTSPSSSCCSQPNDRVYEPSKECGKVGRKFKRMDKVRKRSLKELIERDRWERRQRGNNEIEYIKQYSPTRSRKKNCTCNLPARCSSKDAENKLRSGCASPRWNAKCGSPNLSPASSQNNPLHQYSKGKTKKHKSSSPRNMNARDCNIQFGNMNRNSKTCICPPTIQTGGGWLSKQITRSDFACSPTNLSNPFQESCYSASRNDPYGIGDKTTNDCCSPAGRDNFNDYSKGDKTTSPRARSDHVRRSPSTQSYSKVKCARSGYSKVKSTCSGMSIDTKHLNREPDAVCKMGTLKILDITEYPSRNVGALCNSPNMSTKETCAFAVSKDSQRNIGVLCEGPATTDQCLETVSEPSAGIFENVKDMFRIGCRCSQHSHCSQPRPKSPPPAPGCCGANSSTSFRPVRPDRDNNCGPYPPRSSPSCNPL